MSQRITLLVHAAAPSSRKDDEDQLARAEAYADWNTLGTARLDVSDSKSARHGLGASTPGHHGTEHDVSTTIVPSLSLYIDDTQLAYNALESQVISSSLQAALSRSSETSPAKRSRVSGEDESTVSVSDEHILDSPHWGATSAREFATATNRQAVTACERISPLPRCSLQSSPGPRESQSSYLKPPVLRSPNGRARLTERQSYEDRVTDSFYCTIHQNLRMNPLLAQPTTPENLRVGRPVYDLPGHAESTSELPSSYSLSEISSESSKDKKSLCQGSGCGTAPQHDDRQTTNPQPSQRQEHQINSIIAVSASSSVNEAPEPPGTPDSRKPQPSPPPHKSSPRPTDSTSKVIRPPGPEVSLKPFTTHVTPALRFLAEKAELAGIYKPVSESRALDILERGHWLISCAGWSDETCISFWKCLGNFVGSGSAGWGVWCTRERDSELVVERASSVSDGEEVHLAVEALENGFGPIKVFCWGEVVRHLYLVLYVASNAQVRKHGLQWIDAEGKIVVQMRRPQ